MSEDLIVKSKKYEITYWICGFFMIFPVFLVVLLMEIWDTIGRNESRIISICFSIVPFALVSYIWFQEFIFFKLYKTFEKCPYVNCSSKAKKLEHRELIESNIKRKFLIFSFSCGECNKIWHKEVMFHRFNRLEDFKGYDFSDDNQ